MMLRCLTASVFFASLAHAQTPPCIATNDANNTIGASLTAFGFSGPNANAYRVTPSASVVLQAAEVLTDSSLSTSTNPRGYMTLEVWDENANGLPGTRLAGGTWQSQVALGLAWQGANFDNLVVLNASQNYWVVWRDGGANRFPYEPGGTGLAHARLSGGNWLPQANPQPLKWRGYCTQLDDANVAPIGFGCVSSANRTPAAFTNHAPAIGNANFQLEGTGFPAASIGLVVLGTDPNWVSLPVPGAGPGCMLHADIVATATVLTGTGNEQVVHSTGFAGHTWFDFPIPNNPAFVGYLFNAQFVVLDTASLDPLPFVFSSGVRFVLS